jgi:hypothetical protein
MADDLYAPHRRHETAPMARRKTDGIDGSRKTDHEYTLSPKALDQRRGAAVKDKGLP